MNDIVIFAFGCVVFGVTIASGFIYMIASDQPGK